MIRLDIPTILELHKIICEKTGGDPNVRDMGLLESALASPFQSFGGDDLYPTLKEKGARLGFSLIANHPFVDGNKRIGILALILFFKINECPLSLNDEDIVHAALGVASGEMDYPALLDWVEMHSL